MRIVRMLIYESDSKIWLDTTLRKSLPPGESDFGLGKIRIIIDPCDMESVMGDMVNNPERYQQEEKQNGRLINKEV
jgi:hypothetical protein